MTSQSEDKSPDGFFVGSANQVLDQILFRINGGQHESAEDILRQLIKNRPGHAEAWNLRGLNAIKGGGTALAIECFTKASNIDRNKAVYAANLGNALGLDKRWEQAAGAWSRAILLAPKNPEHQLGLATCMMYQGKMPEALKHGDHALQMHPPPEAIFTFAKSLSKHDQAKPAINAYTAGLSQQPENTEARFQLGALFQKLGDLQNAADCFRAVYLRDPKNVEALCRLSAIAREIGQTKEAIQAGERALSLDPESAEAHNNLGLALCDLRKYLEAIKHFEAALKTTETPYETLNNLGVAHQALGNLCAAENYLRRAIKVSNASPAAERNLGNVLRQAERFNEALSCYQRALKKSPLDFTNYANLGLILINLNRPSDAITVYEKALSLKPNHLAIRKSLGIAQLQCGNLLDGFRNYEARLAKKDGFSKIPRWSPDCKARSVLVTAEQGFGDTLQFCRYLNQLVEMGLEVTFACQPTLVRLMRTVNVAITVISNNDKAPETEAHIPLLSLPFALKSTLETIPADCPYLWADAPINPKWRKISDKTVKSVGLVWSGNPQRQDDRMRSCPPELLGKLSCIKEIDFYSLQKEGIPTGLKGITDLSSHLTDFAETAALIKSLDLIVTVDTAVAHLAGALGKPVWVMLGNTADWRYFLERKNSPWYPHMRLFRQKKPGAWADLMSDVAKSLRFWAATLKKSPDDQLRP